MHNGTAIIAQVAKWLRLTNGPNGFGPSSSGFQRQYISPCPVASCASAIAESTRPVSAIRRVVVRMPPGGEDLPRGEEEDQHAGDEQDRGGGARQVDA